MKPIVSTPSEIQLQIEMEIERERESKLSDSSSIHKDASPSNFMNLKMKMLH